MDKTPEVRRFGANRFGVAKRQSMKQSGFECGQHKQGQSNRRVSREEGEMNSDEEQQLPPTTHNRKRFKFSKKFFDECNNVDHASIPRKIRSAVRKRSGGSISPPLPDMKKVKHMANGYVLPRRNGTKKSKLIMQNGEVERSPKQFDTLPITRDEEEVVETLFALAGMFANNDKIDETTTSRLDCKLSEAKTPSDMAKSSTHDASEVLKKEGDLQTNDTPCLKGSTISAHETYSQEKNPIVLDSLEIPHLNVARILEPRGERQTCNFAGPPMIEHGRSSFPASEVKLDIAMKLVQSEQQPAITRENKLGGSALWPDLSKMRFLDAEKQGPSLQLCAGKLPAWMDSSAKLCSTSRVEVGEKKKNEWKRCSGHVYISRVIKALQVTERSKDEAVLASNNNMYSNACEKTSNGDGLRWSNEVWNGNMALEKKLVQNENQKQVPSLSYTPYSSREQQPSMNLISMSSEDYGRAEKRSKASFNVPPPYLQYIAQNQARIPQQNGYSSSFFPHDLLRHQQQVCMASMQQLQVQRMWMDEYNKSRGIETSAGVHYFAPTTNYSTLSMLPQSHEAKRHYRPCVDQGNSAPHPLHFTFQSPQLPLPSV